MAEFIGPTLENKNIQRRGIASLGRRAKPSESKALKKTLSYFK